MELPGISFAEDEQQLVLSFVPEQGEAQVRIDVPGLRAFAGARGYDQLDYDERSLGAAVVKIRGQEPCTIAIARRTDAEYRVEVAADEMSAWLTVVPARGGKPASALSAVAALGAQDIREGVDAAAVEQAVAQPQTRCRVARGTPTEPGHEAWLEPLVVVNRRRHPQIDASGHADWHDLGPIPSVHAGEPVMRRHPPQPGIPGCNVYGREVAAAPVKDIAFGARLQGVVVSPEDPNLLLAAIAGQPLLQRDGIVVEPIVRYDDVDVSVGNVEFPGSIEVRGDIRSGMKVHAGGDVVVSGVIESAEVRAGGCVRIAGGIIGHCLLPGETEHGATAHTARIQAEGDISARYVENAVLRARNVLVGESIVQSEVSALEEVVVGGKARKGRILGGRVRATLRVAADVLGGDGSGPTRVDVGIDPALQQEIDGHRQRLDAKLREHDDLSKVVKLLHGRADKQALYDKARLTLEKVCEEIGAEMERQRLLEAEARLADSAQVVVRTRACAGVTVGIGGHSRFIKEDVGRGLFHLGPGGRLAFGDPADKR